MGATDGREIMVPSSGATAQGSLISYRARLLQKASQRLPMTAEGLPVGFYRVDLLPMSQPDSGEEELGALKNAYVDLDFSQGFPTLADGRPYWHKLDFEPGFSYGCFQVFLEALNTGPRELSEMSQNAELLLLAGKIHGLNGDGDTFSHQRLYGILLEYSILYSWRTRAKAHDIYKEAAFRHQRLRRQMSTEDAHYTMAVNYLHRLKEEVLDKEGFFEKMKPRDAVEMLQKLVNIQRISAGLPASGPLSMKESPEDTSFEMIMRTLTQKVQQSTAGNVFDQNGAQVSRDVLNSVLEDKDAASMLQEVVIRVTTASHKAIDPDDVNSSRQFKSRGRRSETLDSDDIQPYDVSGAPGENLNGEGEGEGGGEDAAKP